VPLGGPSVTLGLHCNAKLSNRARFWFFRFHF